MTMLFWVKHVALTVKERQVIVTVWVLMRVIVVTLNFHHHQLKEGVVPEADGVPQVLNSVEYILRPSSFTTNNYYWNINFRTQTLSSAEAPTGIPLIKF